MVITDDSDPKHKVYQQSLKLDQTVTNIIIGVTCNLKHKLTQVIIVERITINFN